LQLLAKETKWGMESIHFYEEGNCHKNKALMKTLKERGFEVEVAPDFRCGMKYPCPGHTIVSWGSVE